MMENKRLQIDNDDLQYEFQREREQLLNTIREQEKELLLYRKMLEKMSLIVPRGCNYTNIDKIKDQARFDEDNGQYILPEPTNETVQLPHMGNAPIITNGRLPQDDYITQTKSTRTPIKYTRLPCYCQS